MKHSRRTKKIMSQKTGSMDSILQVRENDKTDDKTDGKLGNLKAFTFQTKKISKHNKTRKIKQFCEIYKKDMTGNVNMPLFNSCKINQYCRKYKCKNIDNKFKASQTKKLGTNYNALLMSSLYSKCPSTMNDKNRKRCYTTNMKKFYKENNLEDVYNKVLECDKKTCAKEKEIFYKNLFRIRKNKKKIKAQTQIVIEDLPDKEMIEIN
jgi:hypothetical protein